LGHSPEASLRISGCIELANSPSPGTWLAIFWSGLAAPIPTVVQEPFAEDRLDVPAIPGPQSTARRSR
jgi:hypothetical protein